MKTTTIPTSLFRWLLSDHRGAAADAVVQHLTGIQIDGCEICDHWPGDMDEVDRIIRLLDDVPEIAWMFERMASCGPRWAALVRAWDDIRAAEGDRLRQHDLLQAANNVQP